MSPLRIKRSFLKHLMNYRAIFFFIILDQGSLALLRGDNSALGRVGQCTVCCVQPLWCLPTRYQEHPSSLCLSLLLWPSTVSFKDQPGISFHPCSPQSSQCLPVWPAVCSGPEHHCLHTLDSTTTAKCQAAPSGISCWELETLEITSPRANGTKMTGPGSLRAEHSTLRSGCHWGRAKHRLAVGLTGQAMSLPAIPGQLLLGECLQMKRLGSK